MHWIPPLGEFLGGLFIGTVRGSSDNVQTAPLTTPFTLSVQSRGHYNHFALSSTLHQAYQMVTHVLSWADLRQTLQVGPSAQDHHPTKMAEGLS
jgi:hypothetical protein